MEGVCFREELEKLGSLSVLIQQSLNACEVTGQGEDAQLCQ